MNWIVEEDLHLQTNYKKIPHEQLVVEMWEMFEREIDTPSAAMCHSRRRCCFLSKSVFTPSDLKVYKLNLVKASYTLEELKNITPKPLKGSITTLDLFRYLGYNHIHPNMKDRVDLSRLDGVKYKGRWFVPSVLKELCAKQLAKRNIIYWEEVIEEYGHLNHNT